jgi:hypothetical protein
MSLWIRCGNENAIFTMGCKNFTENEKGVAGQVERESHVDGFLLHRGCCASWILTSGTNNESLALSRSAEMSKRKCQEEKTSAVEKQRLVSPSWQCASWCIVTDSWLFGQRTQLCFLNHPTHLTWLRQTFSYFPNWNPPSKDDDFGRSKRLRKILRRSYARSRRKAYEDCFQKKQRRWEQCVNAGREYFESDKDHSVAGMSENI